jgi:hypothetical protein
MVHRYSLQDWRFITIPGAILPLGTVYKVDTPKELTVAVGLLPNVFFCQDSSTFRVGGLGFGFSKHHPRFSQTGFSLFNTLDETPHALAQLIAKIIQG